MNLFNWNPHFALIGKIWWEPVAQFSRKMSDRSHKMWGLLHSLEEYQEYYWPTTGAHADNIRDGAAVVSTIARHITHITSAKISTLFIEFLLLGSVFGLFLVKARFALQACYAEGKKNRSMFSLEWWKIERAWEITIFTGWWMTFWWLFKVACKSRSTIRKYPQWF